MINRSNPKVYIIVLSWNRALDTLACLESLGKIDYPYYEIVVVDNGSTDDSVKRIKKSFPEVRLIEAKKNYGYAEGNNIGLKYALGKFAEYVLLLNNDTLVEADFLSKLMAKATTEDDFFTFGPQIREYPKKDLLWYAGGRVIKPLASVSLKCLGKPLKCAKGQVTAKTDFVTGAAMLIKASVLRKIGGFDRRFFCYFEETDWESRALAAGFRMMYVPESVIYHKVARSSGGPGNPKMQYYFYRNNLLYARKNLPAVYWLTIIPFYLGRLFIFELIRAIIDFIILRPKRFLGWLYALRGTFDFIRGKFGKVV